MNTVFKSVLLIPVILLSLVSIVLNSCGKVQYRQTISLNGEWKFFVDSSLSGVTDHFGENGFPENLSRILSVPHAWNADSGLDNYWGKCWYEKEFVVSEEQQSKTTRLQFDGVYHDATIFVNGVHAGIHSGSGYTRFFINVSSFVHAGTNTLRVCVNNSPSESSIPFLKSFDWANDGGIYRSVYLIFTENLAIRNIHVVAVPEGKKGIANIRVDLLDTHAADLTNISFKGVITEENQPGNNQVFSGVLPGKFENGSFICSLEFDKINPWHFDAPNLYKLKLILFADGVEKDEYSAVFGFRRIQVKNNRYYLNGEPVRLMGVEWMPGSNPIRGMAETTADFEKNLNLMKNANCIFTRFHWQQDEFIFDWCDRHGMLIQEEIPYWGGSTIINDTLLEIGKQHLSEMTDAHFNHPSIILWGIGNELQSHNPVNISALKSLYNYAKSIDSSRLVSYVSNNLHMGYPGEKKELPDVTSDFDMMMFNEYYTTWYGKTLDVIPGELEKISAAYPGKGLTISEWGICEPVHKGGDQRRAREMVQQIGIYGSTDCIAGAIYFCLNDYRTHMGEDSSYRYPQRVHGVCDINLNPKPSYDTLKNISSPLEIKNMIQKDGTVSFTLRGKTGIPSYTIRNYTVTAGQDKILIDELKPGEEKTFHIKTNSKEFNIVRSTGFNVAHWRIE